MNLTQIKQESISLCIAVMDGDWDEEISARIKEYRTAIIHSPDWIQKNQHLQIKMLNALFNVELKDDHRWPINVADGHLDEALRIDKEERDKGIPKAIDKTPDMSQLDLLEDSILPDAWLFSHGEGNIGPAWWMDNHGKDPDSWSPVELMWLNKELPKRNGALLDDGEHVFRYLGKGSQDRGQWVPCPEGTDYLFAVYTLENDPRTLSATQPSLDIDLERWLEAYGEQPLPARFMCLTDGRKELFALNKELKSLDGTPVGDEHVWTYHGKVTYKREGKIDIFGCIPIHN